MIAKRNRKSRVASERTRIGGRPLLRRDKIGVGELLVFVGTEGCADCGFEGGACDCTWSEQEREHIELHGRAA